jgi:hypothetical protein
MAFKDWAELSCWLVIVFGPVIFLAVRAFLKRDHFMDELRNRIGANKVSFFSFTADVAKGSLNGTPCEFSYDPRRGRYHSGEKLRIRLFRPFPADAIVHRQGLLQRSVGEIFTPGQELKTGNPDLDKTVYIHGADINQLSILFSDSKRQQILSRLFSENGGGKPSGCSARNITVSKSFRELNLDDVGTNSDPNKIIELVSLLDAL